MSNNLKVTDNFYNDFPARMSDGRFITSYIPNCELNLRGQKNMSSWEYKLLLTRKGNEIRDAIESKTNEVFGCDNCNDPSIPLSNKFQQNCSVNGCRINVVNQNGLGLN